MSAERILLGRVKGDAGTVSVGTTTTGAPGTEAMVTEAPGSTPEDRILDFTIPSGAMNPTDNFLPVRGALDPVYKYDPEVGYSHYVYYPVTLIDSRLEQVYDRWTGDKAVDMAASLRVNSDRADRGGIWLGSYGNSYYPTLQLWRNPAPVPGGWREQHYFHLNDGGGYYSFNVNVNRLYQPSVSNLDYRQITLGAHGYNVINASRSYNRNLATNTTSVDTNDVRVSDIYGYDALHAWRNQLTGRRDFWAGAQGYAVMSASYQYDVVNQTSLFTPDGAERLRLSSHYYGYPIYQTVNKLSLLNQTRIAGLQNGRFMVPDDAATIWNVKYDENANPAAYNRGELFPANEVSNRAAMVSALGGTNIVEDFYYGDLGQLQMPVLQNYVENGTGPGWTISSVRSDGGSYSMAATGNYHKPNTRAIIQFSLPASGITSSVSFRWWIWSEPCCDQMQVELLDLASANVVYSYASASPQQTWNTLTFSRGPGSHLLTIRYRKDGSVDTGDDCLWVDNIAFTGFSGPAPPTQAFVFADGGNYIHAFVHAGEIFETILHKGQSFRNATSMVLRAYDGSAIVNA